MAVRKKKRKKRRKIKLRYYLLFFLILFLIAAFFSYRVFSRVGFQHKTDSQRGESRASAKVVKHTVDIKPEMPYSRSGGEDNKRLPRVAIVVDDLGPNKKPILPLLEMDKSITFSVLPQETYSRWIAEEGHRRGHEIIGHIPMEAREGNNLGRGGLYTRMDESEIRRTLKKDIDSLPYIIGVSNHMGSAFTEDERAVSILLSALREKGIFFLDSMTTSRSAGEKAARKSGIRILKRDIFLDNVDDQDYIGTEWDKLVGIARKKGHAIAIAHPRNNTIEFLERILRKNEVEVVPLSGLINKN